jgi:hypothetical protein
MEIFKYCKLPHMQALQERGSVRVGSLYGYRETETHGEMVSDASEGKKVMSGVISSLTPDNLPKYPDLNKLVSFSYGKIENLQILGRKEFSPNCLIFSASTEYSESTHQSWLDKEGYEACYRIMSTRLFLKAISRQLDLLGYKFWGCAPIHYTDEIDIASPSADIHPALCKKPIFSRQKEIRAIWRPVTDKPVDRHIDLDTSEAFRYVTVHRTLTKSS